MVGDPFSRRRLRRPPAGGRGVWRDQPVRAGPDPVVVLLSKAGPVVAFSAQAIGGAGATAAALACLVLWGGSVGGAGAAGLPRTAAVGVGVLVAGVIGTFASTVAAAAPLFGDVLAFSAWGGTAASLFSSLVGLALAGLAVAALRRRGGRVGAVAALSMVGLPVYPVAVVGAPAGTTAALALTFVVVAGAAAAIVGLGVTQEQSPGLRRSARVVTGGALAVATGGAVTALAGLATALTPGDVDLPALFKTRTGSPELDAALAVVQQWTQLIIIKTGALHAGLALPAVAYAAWVAAAGGRSGSAAARHRLAAAGLVAMVAHGTSWAELGLCIMFGGVDPSQRAGGAGLVVLSIGCMATACALSAGWGGGEADDIGGEVGGGGAPACASPKA